MQDIVPKKSIREITKPKRQISEKVSDAFESKSNAAEYQNIGPKKDMPIFDEEYPHKKPHFPKSERNLGKIFAILSSFIIVGLGIVLHLNQSATVFIETEHYSLSFKNTEINIPEEEYQVLTETISEPIKIITTKGAPVLSKAKGTVIIYNSSQVDQTLVANTRLESNKGFIYRTDAQVIIPKGVTNAGKLTPGSISVSVTADKVGSAYNINQDDFTVPGLKTTSRYKQIYARTKTAISGGSETAALVVDEKDKQTKIDSVLNQKSEELLKKIAVKNRVDSKVIQEPKIKTSFEQKSNEEGIVTLIVTMTSIDHKNLSKVLIKNQKQNIESEMEFISNLEDLKFLYVKDTPDGLVLNVNGTVVVRSKLDLENLKKELTGKNFSQFREIIKKVDGIKESRFTSKPFWISTFPKESRIFIDQK